MYNVIKELDGVVYSDSSETIDLCKNLGIKTTDDKTNWKVVVMCNMHMGQNWEMCEYFMNTGGKTVLMQHAWDSALNLCDKFWDRDMNKFSYYLVGCEQDHKWLGDKYGYDRILNLGIPKLDDLYRIKNSDIDLSGIYEEVGVNSFYLAISPSSVISDGVYREYVEHLIPNSPLPVVFKVHPGVSDPTPTKMSFLSEGKDFKIISDKMEDIDYIYKVIKASSGIVCVESFLSVETSLMDKPVIFHGRNDIPPDFYNRDENINQIERAPIGMSSSLGNAYLKEEQRQIASLYQCDGKNTQRVVTFLKMLYNTLN